MQFKYIDFLQNIIVRGVDDCKGKIGILFATFKINILIKIVENKVMRNSIPTE